MASSTPNLNLLKKNPATDGNDTFNIDTMLNQNWDKIDEAIGSIHLDIPDASLTVKGKVQLSSSTSGTSESLAATEKAVKAVNDSVNVHMADYVKHPAYATVVGTTGLTVTLSPAPTAYVDGMAIAIKIANTSTGATSLNVNGLGVKTIKKANGNDITAGNLKASSIYTVRYNATTGFFILQGEGGDYGTASAEDVRSTKNIGTDMGLVTGTLVTRSSTAQTITPGTTDIVKPAGIYDGAITIKGVVPFASQHTNFDKFSSLTGGAVGVWSTILNVTGKGYLLEAYAYNYAEIKITIDGLVSLWTYSQSGWGTGLFSIDGVPGNNAAGKLVGDNSNFPMGVTVNAQITPNAIRQYADVSCLMGAPIFFSTSLKVEVTNVGTGNQNIYYGMRGGFR